MLEGEIGQIKLIDRLVELWREKFTGALRFENDSIIKIIYFKGGDILSASTNDRADSIDEILMRGGKVSREHVKQALARRKENETLGDALLNLGFITRKELTWARRIQVVGVIRSIAAWATGSFTIVADYLPKRDEGTQFPLPQLVVELIVTDNDRQKFESLLDGGAAVFARAPEFDRVYPTLGLNEDADAITAHIDGRRSAAEIAEASRRDLFNAYKLLHALGVLGLVERAGIAESAQTAPEDFSAVGVADAENHWDQVTAAESPMFDIDEHEAGRQPTIELAIAGLDGLDPAPTAPLEQPQAGWGDETLLDEAPPTPGWTTPPRESVTVPIPAAVEPAAELEEERWAGVEPSPGPLMPPSPANRRPAPRSRFGLLIALMVAFILAAGAYYAYLSWDRRTPAGESSAAPVAVVPTQTAEGIPAPRVEAGEETGDPATALEPASPPEIPPAAGIAPAAVPGNAPPAATPAPAVDRLELDELARRYAASPEGNFTIQIQILCDPGNLQAAIRAGGENVWFVPQAIGGRSCYRVFWGRFATEAEAQQAMANVPAGLRDRSAAVKRVPAAS